MQLTAGAGSEADCEYPHGSKAEGSLVWKKPGSFFFRHKKEFYRCFAVRIRKSLFMRLRWKEKVVDRTKKKSIIITDNCKRTDNQMADNQPIDSQGLEYI